MVVALFCGEVGLEDLGAWDVAGGDWLVLVVRVGGFEFEGIDLASSVVLIGVRAVGVVGFVDVAHGCGDTCD